MNWTTLIPVVVGGVIGIVGPLLSILLGNRHQRILGLEQYEQKMKENSQEHVFMLQDAQRERLRDAGIHLLVIAKRYRVAVRRADVTWGEGEEAWKKASDGMKVMEEEEQQNEEWLAVFTLEKQDVIVAAFDELVIETVLYYREFVPVSGVRFAKQKADQREKVEACFESFKSLLAECLSFETNFRNVKGIISKSLVRRGETKLAERRN